ncbi:MAG: hypothetical protein PVH65_11965 [Chloroflexota bacterium]|jgi:DNA repair exonuclease SbcCD ATPase subunit
MTPVETRTYDFTKQAETQVKDWLDHFNRLEEKMQNAGDDIDQMYHQRITDLKSNLDEVQERLDDLKSSGQDDWNQRRHRFEQASSNYKQSYTTLIKDMKEDKRVSTGWLEGLTDKKPAGFVDWLEDMVENIPESEGGKEVFSRN